MVKKQKLEEALFLKDRGALGEICASAMPFIKYIFSLLSA